MIKPPTGEQYDGPLGPDEPDEDAIVRWSLVRLSKRESHMLTMLRGHHEITTGTRIKIRELIYDIILDAEQNFDAGLFRLPDYKSALAPNDIFLTKKTRTRGYKAKTEKGRKIVEDGDEQLSYVKTAEENSALNKFETSINFHYGHNDIIRELIIQAFEFYVEKSVFIDIKPSDQEPFYVLNPVRTITAAKETAPKVTAPSEPAPPNKPELAQDQLF